MPRSIIGLEIGNSNIKIIEVVKKGPTLIVKRFSLLPTPEDCIQNGVISDEERLRSVIQEELKKKKYTSKKVVAIIQSNGIIIRNAIMDAYPDKVIRQLLEIKTQDYLPVETGQYQVDYRIMNTIEEEGHIKNKLLLVAAPNTVILPVANLIKSLKLTPVLISIPSEALTNIFSSKKTMIYKETGNVLVLDIGSKSTTVTVIEEGEALLTRMINFGVASIDQSIKEEEIGPQTGTGDLEELLTHIIRPQIEYNIVSEIERILQFYYSSYNGGLIKKIYLIGGGATIKGIREYMTEALNIPTERLTQFDTVMAAPGIEFEAYAKFYVNLLGAINGL